MTKQVPLPPVIIYAKTYYLEQNEKGELEAEFDRNVRILQDIESTTKIPITKLFHLFDRKIGIKSDFKQLNQIFQKNSIEVVKAGFEEMIQVCGNDLNYKDKVKTYFLNSLIKFIENKEIQIQQQDKLTKESAKFSVNPIEVEPLEGYTEYVAYVFPDDIDIQNQFSKLYKCICGRTITLEVDECPGCKKPISWEKVSPDKFFRRRRTLLKTKWEEYSKKFITDKNYGDWPNSVHEQIKCNKCNNGTIIKKDESGEEYTDYCDCILQNQAVMDFKKKLLQANIPKDFWYLTTDSYVNPSTLAFERIENELNILIIKKYIDKLDYHLDNGTGLYLYGDNNTGKTMFMAIIMKEAIKKGYKVLFHTMSEIITGCMQNWFEKRDISFFKECDLLGVDDSFDRRKTYTSENKLQISQIDDLFRHRIHHWNSTMITANIAIDDLESADSILNLNLVRLLNRKLFSLTFRGDYTINLQNKLKGEMIG